MMDVHTKVYNFLKEIETNKNSSLISLTVANKDEVLFDFKKEPYLKEGKQLVFSVTKSITSLAIGMLYDKGLIDFDKPIIEYFKDELPSVYDPKIKDITIRHLLTMTTGIIKENNKEMLKTDDYRTYFLSQEVVYTPGTHYHYHSATSHMLSALFTKISGQTVESYLQRHLFNDLGIINYHWGKAKEGINFGGYGLSINNDAMVKVGQLLLNNGMYGGKRYVSEKYLKMATSPQSVKQDYVNNPNAKAIGYQYGFQFHVSPNLSYRADGAYGQIIVIFNDLAIISTAQYIDYENLYGLIYKHFTNDTVKPVKIEKLNNYLSSQTFKVEPKSNPLNLNQSFELEDNLLSIKQLKFSHDYLLVTYCDGKTDQIEYNFNQDMYGESIYSKDLFMVKQPHWVIPDVEKNVLTLKVLYIETPFFAEYQFRFDNQKLEFKFIPSPNFLLNGFTVMSK